MHPSKTLHLVPIALTTVAGLASAQTTVIYSEIAASPTGIVPGALDGASLPVVTNWLAIEDLNVRADGGAWVIKGRTTQATTNDSILVLGGGTSGTMFMQDGQPMLGGTPTEQYDFFDSPTPLSWNTAGDIGLSFRAKGGVANTLEKVVRVVGGVHTQILQQGALLTGLSDIPANPTGDETLGNSVGGVQLLDDGRIHYAVTPIGACSSLRYPAVLRDAAAFRQSGVSVIGAEIWDNFDFDSGGATPDGAHWFSHGDTENPTTTIDGIVAVDDVVVLREGSPCAPGGPTVAAMTFTRMLSNGSWLSRGGVPTPALDDWAVRDGVLLAKTGDIISGTEAWGATFSGLNGRTNGDWVMTGVTNNPDVNLDEVLVLNGTQILLRESDPVDLDGNGSFDDNVFIRTFQPNDLFITPTGAIYCLVTLKDNTVPTPVNLGDAFLRIEPPQADGPFCFGDNIDPDVTTDCPCANFGTAGNGCANSVNANGANLTASGTTNPDTMLLSGSGMPAVVACIYLQGDALGDIVFGDGVRCTDGTLIRLRTVDNVGGASSFPDSTETVTLSVRGGVVPGSGAVRYYQTYYRNAAPLFCPPETFNVTNGWKLTW